MQLQNKINCLLSSFSILFDHFLFTKARKNREISSLQRKIDEVPSRAELTQYQRRFVELYNHGLYLYSREFLKKSLRKVQISFCDRWNAEIKKQNEANLVPKRILF